MLQQSRLPPEVNRILYVRNLPFTMTAEELYGIFGKYGAVYQIRLGDRHKDTRGTAFVVYEDIYDAKTAVDHLSGFNVGGKFCICLGGRVLFFNFCFCLEPLIGHSNDCFWNCIWIDNKLGRYLVVLYYQPAKFQRRAEAAEKQKELEELRRRVQKKKAQMAAK